MRASWEGVDWGRVDLAWRLFGLYNSIGTREPKISCLIYIRSSSRTVPQFIPPPSRSKVQNKMVSSHPQLPHHHHPSTHKLLFSASGNLVPATRLPGNPSPLTCNLTLSTSLPTGKLGACSSFTICTLSSSSQACKA